ncbi:MAG: histidine--tRNA ligase [Clostridia bacterium]|nr:histidine--tRNA ligase [Clostridia bacterium]
MGKELLSTQPYKGTRDFYPEDMDLRNWFFGVIKDTLRKFNYREYDGPMLESYEMYAAKSGEEIVNEQTYHFTDNGGRTLAVRPEMTPTVARMVAAKLGSLNMPLRWFSIPNLYRYEKPQRGRLREHWQVNVDMFGSDSVETDLELLIVASSLLKAFGADSSMYQIKINNRRFYNDLFEQVMGFDKEQSRKVSKAIDKKAKMPQEDFNEYLKDLGLNDEQVVKLNSFFEMPLAEMTALCPESQGAQELNKLFDLIDAAGMSDICEFDFGIIRGFDYYTGTVFEVYDTDINNNRAMFGGGRYDNLINLFVDKANVSGIGFGFGDVTLENFLVSHNLVPELNYGMPRVLVTRFPEIPYGEYLKLAEELRANNISVSVYTDDKKLAKQMKYAADEKYDFAIILGEDELKNNTVVLKDLSKGENIPVSRQDLVAKILEK